MTLPLLTLLAACADDAKTDALSARLDKLEAADTVDVGPLQASVEALDARTATLEESTATLGESTADLKTSTAAIGLRVTALERASGNDFWSVGGSCDCTVTYSSTWLDVSGASVYVLTTKPGPVAVWGSLYATNTYATTSVRLHMESVDGSWSDDSVETYGLYGGSVAGVFEPPGPGGYSVTLQYSGNGYGTLNDYSVVAIQLTEGV